MFVWDHIMHPQHAKEFWQDQQCCLIFLKSNPFSYLNNAEMHKSNFKTPPIIEIKKAGGNHMVYIGTIFFVIYIHSKLRMFSEFLSKSTMKLLLNFKEKKYTSVSPYFSILKKFTIIYMCGLNRYVTLNLRDFHFLS